MKNIRLKLNNSQGVSIIIAMVFMLICLFVGGTVLTAATVTSGRVENLDKRQAFLEERSAAMLIAEELKTADNHNLTLDIIKETQIMDAVSITGNGKIVKNPQNHGETTSYTFIASHDLSESPLQEIAVEAAIRRFQVKNPRAHVNGVQFTKNDGSNGMILEKDFIVSKLTLHNDPSVTKMIFDGQLGADASISVEHELTCTSNTENEVTVQIDGSSEVNLIVKMWAQSTKRAYPEVVEYFENQHTDNGISNGIRYATTREVTTIYWSTPEIIKGGV